jgi:hypothetical protein
VTDARRLRSVRTVWIRPTYLALLLGLGACRRGQPDAVADLADTAPAPPASAVSRFSVPLAFDFTAVLPTIERAVPRRFGSLDSIRALKTDPRKRYAFVADRDAFTTFAEGNELHIRTTLAYSARVSYDPPVGPTISASCGQGDTRPRITIELATPLTLRPNWRLASRSRLVNIGPTTFEGPDKCSMSVLRLDMTDEVVDAARAAITAKLPEIDRKIGEVSIEQRMVGWWQLLTQPIRVADGVWLVLGAERLHSGRPSGRGRVLTIPVSLDAHPRIVMSARAPAIADTPLPPLGRDTASAGFRVTLDGTVDYTAASIALGERFAGRSLERAGRTVRVTTVVVAPTDSGRVMLDVTFAGDAVGTLRLTGRPIIDRATREVVVPDLAFDLESDNQLINAYSWLASDELREMIRDRARIPVDSAMARARGLLVQGLNRKIGTALTLSGTVDSVSLEDLFVTRRALVVRATASGQARVAIRPR